MKKYLIITIDTEGDNLWNWKQGEEIYTENTKHLRRFQNLCNKYNFKPVWLSNYEMICNDEYVRFIKEVEKTGTGELGMHLHAWNNPPLYDLPITKKSAQSYLIEYPEEVMEEKISTLTNLIIERTGIRPISHRAGRWATNDIYFKLLLKNGYKIDCSVTPGVDWSKHLGQTGKINGTNYNNYNHYPYFIDEEKKLLEVPVSIKHTHRIFMPSIFNITEIARKIKKSIYGQNIWIRPTGNNYFEMKWLLKKIYESNNDYAMFMIHSSELMPGGSPTFKDTKSIDNLYKCLESLFEFASKYFEGITLRDYYEVNKLKNNKDCKKQQ